MEMQKNERFYRFLLDGGFSFGDKVIPPVWGIDDRSGYHSPILYLQFTDDQKDLCDDLCNWLNNREEKINFFKKQLKNKVI